MVKTSDLVKEWYRPCDIAKLLGVSSRTILNYKDKGLFRMRLDTENNRCYASRSEVIKLLKIKGVFHEDTINTYILYARVSSHDQKKNGDLVRQIQTLIDYCAFNRIHNYEIYSDVSSGLNCNRSGLDKVIKRIMEGNVTTVFVTYKDRLTRFGFEYLETFFKYFGTNIVILQDNINKSAQDELVDDMMSLLASFSGKLYGMRSSKKKKAKDYIDSIQEVDT